MFSDDLLTEILVRLPVKSILCCKSVCKPWLSLITNPNFIKSQLNHTLTKPGGDETLIVYGQVEDDYSTSLLHLDSPEIEAPLGFPFSQGDFPFDPYFDIVNSHNGIVCVALSYCPRNVYIDIECPLEDMHNRNDPLIYLWNPATKHSRLIPRSNRRAGEDSTVAIGFGFDPICNDFKVVWLEFDLFLNSFRAEIFSLNRNAWRVLEDPADFPYVPYIDVCVNGLLCCFGFNYFRLMTVDLNKEVFTCGIGLPVEFLSSLDRCITDFNDSVAVLTVKQNELNYMFNLWMLDNEACLGDGGIEASWSLRLTISVECSGPDPRVYCCFRSGDFQLDTGNGVRLLFNSDRKEARNVPFSNKLPRRIIKHNETLVSIAGSKQVH